MATQVFAEEELERLRGFPEIGRDELFRIYHPGAGGSGLSMFGWRRSIGAALCRRRWSSRSWTKLLLARALEHDSPTDLRHPPHAHQLKP